MIILKVTKKSKVSPSLSKMHLWKNHREGQIESPAILGLKHHLFIYADLECLIENIDRCKKKI